MTERAGEVREPCANYALPALPTYPALPKNTPNSPSTPTTTTSTREQPPVDGPDPEITIVQLLREHCAWVEPDGRPERRGWQAHCRCGWANRYWNHTDATMGTELHIAFNITEVLRPVVGSGAQLGDVGAVRVRLEAQDRERAAVDQALTGGLRGAAAARREHAVIVGLDAATGVELLTELERRLA